MVNENEQISSRRYRTSQKMKNCEGLKDRKVRARGGNDLVLDYFFLIEQTGKQVSFLRQAKSQFEYVYCLLTVP